VLQVIETPGHPRTVRRSTSRNRIAPGVGYRVEAIEECDPVVHMQIEVGRVAQTSGRFAVRCTTWSMLPGEDTSQSNWGVSIRCSRVTSLAEVPVTLVSCKNIQRPQQHQVEFGLTLEWAGFEFCFLSRSRERDSGAVEPVSASPQGAFTSMIFSVAACAMACLELMGGGHLEGGDSLLTVLLIGLDVRPAADYL